MQEFQNNSNLTKYLDNIWEKIEYKGITSPEPRSGHCSVIFQDRFLFIFGGYNDKEALNDMYKCDMNNLVWEKVEYLNKENEIPSSKKSLLLKKKNSVKIFLFSNI